MKRITRTVLFGAIALLIHGSSAQAYRPVIDLGTLAGHNCSVAYSINDNGQIVGYSGDPGSTGEPRACLFDPTGGGANINLGGLGGDYWGEARYINNNGQVVGYADNSSGASGYGRPCLFDPTGGGANTDLGTFGGSVGQARCINNSGQIVGWGCDSSNYLHACLFDPTGGGANTDLLGRFASSINDSGQIVGDSLRACLFDPSGGGANINLGTLGRFYSEALSINNSGQIVGCAENSAGKQHACLFDPTGGGNNIDLEPGGVYSPSFAFSINDSGQIVGFLGPSAQVGRACLFDPTGQGNNIDLNTLIDPSSGWTLTGAYSINNNGWIVGYGTNPDGYGHAFLLTPEPTTLLLLGFGGLMLRKGRV
jgi:probable HAF family extracellular repeat protein